MPQFLIPPGHRRGERVSLSPEEAHHARNVFRLRRGDEVRLADGAGHRFSGRIEEVGIRSVSVFLEKELLSPATVKRLLLYQGILKGEKMEWLVQKATELGAAELHPFVSSRSVVKLTRDKTARWQKISDEAMKQSGRAERMVVFKPKTYEELLDQGHETLKVLFWEEGKTPLRERVAALKEEKEVIVTIGPEGGFSKEEVRKAKEKGFLIASLGNLTLRAETAALAALSLLQYELDNL